MRSWSSRKRRAALAMLSWSSPTLKAMMAWHRRAIPCLVTHSSATSDSCMASVSVLARDRTGSTKAPCPVTILKGRPFSVLRLPLMSNASSGAGTCQPNM